MKVLVEKASNGGHEDDLEEIIEMNTIDDIIKIIKEYNHSVIIEIPNELSKSVRLKWNNIPEDAYDLILTIYDDWIE